MAALIRMDERPLRVRSLEVVRDADDRIAYVVIAIGAEIGYTEAGSFVYMPTVLSADIKARADFIGDTSTIKQAHIGALRSPENVGLGIIDWGKNESSYASLNEGIPVPENKTANIGSGDFLKASVNRVVILAGSVMVSALRILVIQFQTTAGRKQVPIAE